MTPDQLATICSSIEAGSGRYAACQQAGVTLPELAEAMTSSPPLRQRIALLEGVCRDRVRSVLYAKATEDDSLPAAKAYLQSLSEERMGRLDYRLKRRQVVASEKLADHVTTPRPDFSALSNEEFRRYKELHIILRARSHTPTEAAEYSAFAHRLASVAGRSGLNAGRAEEGTMAWPTVMLPYRPNGTNGTNGHT